MSMKIKKLRSNIDMIEFSYSSWLKTTEEISKIRRRELKNLLKEQIRTFKKNGR